MTYLEQMVNLSHAIGYDADCVVSKTIKGYAVQITGKNIYFKENENDCMERQFLGFGDSIESAAKSALFECKNTVLVRREPRSFAHIIICRS